MDDTPEPLGPVLVFSEKHHPIATGLFPLLAKVERQHTEGRRRRDRGNRGSSAFIGRAFPGRPAAVDLFAFFHQTSIVIQERSCCELSATYQLFTFHPCAEPDPAFLETPQERPALFMAAFCIGSIRLKRQTAVWLLAAVQFLGFAALRELSKSPALPSDLTNAST
jgi:hypothetical protein